MLNSLPIKLFQLPVKIFESLIKFGVIPPLNLSYLLRISPEIFEI